MFSGVCHADELMYLFNLDLPLVLCDVGEVFGNCFGFFDNCFLIEQETFKVNTILFKAGCAITRTNKAFKAVLI